MHVVYEGPRAHYFVNDFYELCTEHQVGTPLSDKASGDGESNTGTTRYHETSNAELIQSSLNGVRAGVGDDWKASRLTCYAHLETERWCYRRDEVTVVVDVTDWGYRVGEVEVVVEDAAEVPAAVDRIEQIARDMSE